MAVAIVLAGVAAIGVTDTVTLTWHVRRTAAVDDNDNDHDHDASMAATATAIETASSSPRKGVAVRVQHSGPFWAVRVAVRVRDADAGELLAVFIHTGAASASRRALLVGAHTRAHS